jgi:hypothetical protein
VDGLSSSEGCLAEWMSGKTAEIIAAKRDPKRIFGRHLSSPLPDADAVDLCVAQIHSANSCENFLGVNRVFQIGNEVAEQSALVFCPKTKARVEAGLNASFVRTAYPKSESIALQNTISGRHPCAVIGSEKLARRNVATRNRFGGIAPPNGFHRRSSRALQEARQQIR